MATVARIGPYRFFFFSNEGSEPRHVHVQRDRSLAKFWLEPVALASSVGFRAQELRELERIVGENRKEFTEGCLVEGQVAQVNRYTVMRQIGNVPSPVRLVEHKAL